MEKHYSVTALPRDWLLHMGTETPTKLCMNLNPGDRDNREERKLRDWKLKVELHIYSGSEVIMSV